MLVQIQSSGDLQNFRNSWMRHSPVDPGSFRSEAVVCLLADSGNFHLGLWKLTAGDKFRLELNLLAVENKQLLLPVRRCFAFCKFLIFDNDIGCVYFLTIAVCVASGLNAATNSNLCSLFKILFRDFCKFSKCQTTDIVGCWLIAILRSVAAIYSKSISCNTVRRSPANNALLGPSLIFPLIQLNSYLSS